MRKIFYAGILLALFTITTAPPLFANNLNLGNITLTGQQAASGYTDVRFDISWENSWRTSTAPNNWDAAWIFVKYRVGNGTWNHATLKSTGHTAPAGSTISAPADNTGVFFYRAADGSGTFSKTGVKLRWDYAANGVDANDIVDIKVFAIEMVYVPQGAFYVGSGGTGDAQLYRYSGTPTAYQILNENEIPVGSVDGNLNYISEHIDQGDMGGPIPAEFPKGFNAMYTMKYELTQQQYVDFLNALPRNQQDTRTGVDLATGETTVTNRYIMSNSSIQNSRNGIRCDASIHATNPITFYCDYNDNGLGGEASDGQHIACNYINWADVVAYLDWAALRPMTEIEYEKNCRGTKNPVLNEYAWGSASSTQNTGITNPGSANEVSTNGGNATFKNGGVMGPMRVGAFSTVSSNRIQAGATYYGVMEMSGNSWERPVTIGTALGRAYTGLHGNGILNANGDADVANWPGINADGAGFRGGWWNESNIYMRVSARGYASHVGDLRRERMGGRGVRTVN